MSRFTQNNFYSVSFMVDYHRTFQKIFLEIFLIFLSTSLISTVKMFRKNHQNILKNNNLSKIVYHGENLSLYTTYSLHWLEWSNVLLFRIGSISMVFREVNFQLKATIWICNCSATLLIGFKSGSNIFSNFF